MQYQRIKLGIVVVYFRGSPLQYVMMAIEPRDKGDCLKKYTRLSGKSGLITPHQNDRWEYHAQKINVDRFCKDDHKMKRG